MSYLIAFPDILTSAAAELAAIGSSVSAAHAAAAASTTGILAPAEDEVSAAITALLSARGQDFQALGTQASAFHSQFVQALTASVGSYADAEAANALAVAASPAQTLEQDVFAVISAPLRALTGRAPIGPGSVGGGLAAVGQQIQQIPTTLATGFTETRDAVVAGIFGVPADSPFPAAQPGTFTGSPSLATRLEISALWPVKDFLDFSGIYNQWGMPNSPFLALVAANTPPLSLILGNSPPRLLPLLLGETVQHSTFDRMSVVQITPAHPSGNYVVAIHGGAFILPPTLFHWLDYTVMAYQTGATIEVPIYPLMQQGGTAGTVVPAMAGLISAQIAAHGASHVSVLGDSAGGTLALAATEYLVANGNPVESSMVLLSPWLDLGLTNPNIGFVQDPLLPPLGTGAQQIGKIWAGSLPEDNYLVSPLYGSLQGLPTTTIYAGNLDSVAPDVLVLQQEAALAGAPMSFVLGNGGIHDWVLLTPDGFQYWPQIDQELGV
ncbi:PE domain-containing protein [Mycobacterium parmense]|uniref:Uncharacterized protein n=1 Tax=Mycobacterium parmense TaxID=185642 RepID=A0A7I7Z2B6_9MYCO|nr:PE domain-containing protein [Mycobacterium parmense]MCV7352114.1 PE domain-containing protein [Mycobacterium parmense]ORW56110.1 lipase [Mycobacterium parmense]BBZ48170.1 hypothetical protein MPRM_54510 [Mycobacterium parmense]